jgi:cysteine desulfurase
VFTSGGTEANNLAIFGAARARRDRGRHLICSAIEHHAVLHSFEYLARREGFTLTLLPVDSLGRVAPEDVLNALRPDTVLVSVMAANNETGTLQPVPEIGCVCRERGVLFHTDAVQWFGKEPISSVDAFHADLVAVCGHKFHGPRGVGALFVRSPLTLDPILFGGSHEYERRAGTENVPAILGFAEAVGRFVPEPVFDARRLGAWTRQLSEVLLSLDGVLIHGDRDHRLANTVAFTVAGADSLALLASLDLEGVCASSGSACSVGSLEPSHVLQAMGVPHDLARSLVRFSLGRENTAEEVSRVCELLPQLLRRIRLSG